MPPPCCAGRGWTDLDCCRVARRRRAASASSAAGPRRRHRRARRTAPVRAPHLHAADASVRLLDRRGLPGLGPMGGPAGAGTNDLEPAAAGGRAAPGRAGGDRLGEATASNPASPAAGRPGSSRATSPATSAGWCAPCRPRPSRRHRVGARPTTSVSRPQSSIVELLGPGLGAHAGRGERLGSTSPASERRSILRRCPNAVRTRANSRAAVRVATAGAGSAHDAHAAPTRPWAGAGTPSAAPARRPRPSPSRRPSPTGCRRRSSPGPAASRSPTSRCTMTSIRSMRRDVVEQVGHERGGARCRAGWPRAPSGRSPPSTASQSSASASPSTTVTPSGSTTSRSTGSQPAVDLDRGHRRAGLGRERQRERAERRPRSRPRGRPARRRPGGRCARTVLGSTTKFCPSARLRASPCRSSSSTTWRRVSVTRPAWLPHPCFGAFTGSGRSILRRRHRATCRRRPRGPSPSTRRGSGPWRPGRPARRGREHPDEVVATGVVGGQVPAGLGELIGAPVHAVGGHGAVVAVGLARGGCRPGRPRPRAGWSSPVAPRWSVRRPGPGSSARPRRWPGGRPRSRSSG